jgi:hypothetical protein
MLSIQIITDTDLLPGVTLPERIQEVDITYFKPNRPNGSGIAYRSQVILYVSEQYDAVKVLKHRQGSLEHLVYPRGEAVPLGNYAYIYEAEREPLRVPEGEALDAGGIMVPELFTDWPWVSRDRLRWLVGGFLALCFLGGVLYGLIKNNLL